MEMSESAILNLGESLNLIKGTVETLYKREADYQKLVAREMAAMEEPENFVRSYESDKTIAKILFIRTGNTKGISNTGESFSEDELDFSGGFSVEGLPISTSYVNDLGTWAWNRTAGKSARFIWSIFMIRLKKRFRKNSIMAAPRYISWIRTASGLS